MVLGVDWLETLGLVGWNFQHKTMEFTVDGVNHRLVEAAGSLQSTAQLCPFTVELAQYGWHSKNTSVSTPLPQPLQQLIDFYVELFAEPTSLPPARSIDHQITLTIGTTPISIRPYWYAHSQKSEIEAQVRDMLKTGLIHCSTSPF